ALADGQRRDGRAGHRGIPPGHGRGGDAGMTTLLLMLAHPDDESMGNGMLIARHVAEGCAVHLVCATRGGAGWTGRPTGRSPDELTAIRGEELAQAARVLQLASVEVWDYPDGGVPGCDQQEITDRIRDAVARLRPDAVVGWGPDGGYGHPDHICIGKCTDAAVASLPQAARPAQYHMVMDQFLVDAYKDIISLVSDDTDSLPLIASDVDVIVE